MIIPFLFVAIPAAPKAAAWAVRHGRSPFAVSLAVIDDLIPPCQ